MQAHILSLQSSWIHLVGVKGQNNFFSEGVNLKGWLIKIFEIFYKS